MAYPVEKMEVWRGEVEDQPGALSKVLEPMAKAGADLTVLLAYPHPKKSGWAQVLLAPVKGKRQTEAAKALGFSPDEVPAVRLEGVNKPGVGSYITQTIARKGVNIYATNALVAGNRFVMLFRFLSSEDANRVFRALKALKPLR